jgi:hypothetical protein
VASFDEVVPPGQAGSIKVSIHTANYKGPIGKGITVTHDDTSQGPIMLSVKANVVGSAVVFPYPSLTLAPRMKGFKQPAQLLIRRDETEKGTLDITGLTASVPWLKTTLRKVTAPEPAVEGLPAAIPGDYVISVLVDHAPVGSTAQTLTFKTGLTRESQMTIPVMVTVRAPVVLQPNELILQPKPEASDEATGQILAAIREDLDPKTLVVTADDKAFVVKLDPPGERAFKLIVDWKAKGKKSATETTVHLRVGEDSVDLPVRVNLSRVATGADPKAH